jgi:RpiR family carbohydrate utilization transcriptional regulator
MSSSSILNRIDAQLDTLSHAETKVARWVRANPRQTVDASIAAVAAAAEVSEPTVIRFCRSLGMSGFRELRTRLIAALERAESYLHQDVDSADDTADAVGKVLGSAIRALVDLRQLAARMPFEAAVEALSKARQIVFAGLGASGFVARDVSHKFFRLGLPCSTAADAQTILQHAAIAQASDVHVVISHTGGWPELVRATGLARARGATVIALTDPHAPLAAAATLVFECHPPEDTNVFTPMSSRLVQLALLDALQVALALRQGPLAQANLKLAKEALAGQPANS